MIRAVVVDLADEKTLALLNLPVETIEANRYPYSPRIQQLLKFRENSANCATA